jgi:hypothetical protein
LLLGLRTRGGIRSASTSVRTPRAKPVRVRGSRRVLAATQGQDDSGGESSDPDGDSEPQAVREPRYCECGCGENISHRSSTARYVDEIHGARHRKRKQRARDRLASSRERLALLPSARRDLCVREGGPWPHRDPDGDLRCVRCGRALSAPVGRVNGYDATFALMVGDHYTPPRLGSKDWATRARPSTRLPDRVCEGCGTVFTPKRPGARFCLTSCRSRVAAVAA